MNNYDLQADSFNRWFEEYDRRNREAYDAHAIAKYHMFYVEIEQRLQKEIK